jgi:co-chaperonin GroES (HSP10)
VSRGDSEEIPANIKVGTKVVIEKGLSQKYEFEGDTYLMCSVFDILAVIEE